MVKKWSNVSGQMVKRWSNVVKWWSMQAAGRCEASIRIELSDLVVKQVVKWWAKKHWSKRVVKAALVK